MVLCRRFVAVFECRYLTADDRATDGSINESETYAQLVNNPNSRLRVLMATQLSVTSEETLKHTSEPEVTEEQKQSP